MSEPITPAEDDFEADEGGYCECDGSGIIVVCPDDTCRAVGECMHGDGEIFCECGAYL